MDLETDSNCHGPLMDIICYMSHRTVVRYRSAHALKVQLDIIG